MAFQDFDRITERRQLARKQKIKRRLIIVLAIICLILIVVSVVGIVYHVTNQKNLETKQPDNESDNKKPPKSPSLDSNKTPPPPESPNVDSNKKTPQPLLPESTKVDSNNKTLPEPQNVVQKKVTAVCAGTDYKNICEDRLAKSLNRNAQPAPKDIVNAAFAAPSDEIKKIVEKVSGLKYTDSPIKQAAVEDCVELLNDALEEFNASTSRVTGMDLAKQSVETLPELNNWLSAALSLQQTCIDGFPDGQEKTELEKLLTDAKALSSNALAIVSGMESMVKGSALQRKLLRVDQNGITVPRRFLKQDEAEKAPNVTVAKDGSGNFNSISKALNAMPQLYEGRYVIYVKEGVYEENVVIDKKMKNVTILGEGSDKTIVSGSKNVKDGVTVYRSATFAVQGEGFMAKDIGFQNTAGPEKNEAVALRVQADHAIFVECRMEGYQNVLFAQSHRQFYRRCEITGTVDIIFGDAAAVFQNCIINVRKPLENQKNTVVAQGRVDKRETTGIVIQNGLILAAEDLEVEKGKFQSYLGRPWKEYSRAVVMQAEIGDLITAEGWLEWQKDFGVNTAYLGEFQNKGIGAKTSGRVKWPAFKAITKEDAKNFTVAKFLQGESWIKSLGVPVRFGLYNN